MSMELHCRSTCFCRWCSAFSHQTRRLRREARDTKSLRANGLSLTLLPRALVTDLRGATEIWLQDNCLSELPSGCELWTAAELVYLSNNDVVALPLAAESWTKLQELNLSGNSRIAELPAQVARAWIDLRQVYLNDMPLLRSLPSTISSWKALRVLHISNSGLAELPQSVVELNELRQVNLSGNSLRHLPEGVGRAWRSVEKMFLNANELEALPEDIAGMVELQKLYASENAIASVPLGLGNLPALEELYLVHNRLVAIPADALGNRLTKLYVDSNPKLNALPADLDSRCPKLQILHANDCAIDALPSISTKVSFVHLANNGLNVEPDKAREWLRSLERQEGLRVLEVSPGNPCFGGECAEEVSRVSLVKAWTFQARSSGHSPD